MPRTSDWFTIEPMRYGLRIRATKDNIVIIPQVYKDGRWDAQHSIVMPSYIAFRILRDDVLLRVSKFEPQAGVGNEE